MKYLLDTNAVSAVMRRKLPAVGQRLAQAIQADAEIVISVIVLLELHYGALHSPHPDINRERYSRFIDRFGPVQDFNEQDALEAGEIRSYLASRGELIGPMDTLIAAQALRMEATLVTANTREFARVPGLKWEDWSVEMA